MKISQLMENKSSEYTKSERLVYEKIKNNLDDISRLTATAFAAKHHISQASVTRFAKKLGYSGYNDLKYEISREIITLDDSNLPMYKHYANVIEEMEFALQNQDIETFQNLIVSAKNIFISGIQRNLIPSILLDYNLKEFGYCSQIIDYGNLNRIASFSSNQDLLFIFSYSGNKNNFTGLLENYLLKDEKMPKLILITGNPDATMIPYAHQTFTIPQLNNMGNAQTFFCILIDLFFRNITVKSSII